MCLLSYHNPPTAAERSERTNARAERVARSPGLSEAQPSAAGPHMGKHLEDAKTDATATKIRILQMPHVGDNITGGLRPPGSPPATRLSYASALLLSEAPRCQLILSHRFNRLKQINTAALWKSVEQITISCGNLCLLKPPHLLNKSICFIC